MKNCRFCGNPNEDTRIYCSSCDSPLDPTAQHQIPEELRRAIENNSPERFAAVQRAQIRQRSQPLQPPKQPLQAAVNPNIPLQPPHQKTKPHSHGSQQPYYSSGSVPVIQQNQNLPPPLPLSDGQSMEQFYANPVGYSSEFISEVHILTDPSSEISTIIQESPKRRVPDPATEAAYAASQQYESPSGVALQHNFLQKFSAEQLPPTTTLPIDETRIPNVSSQAHTNSPHLAQNHPRHIAQNDGFESLSQSIESIAQYQNQNNPRSASFDIQQPYPTPEHPPMPNTEAAGNSGPTPKPQSASVGGSPVSGIDKSIDYNQQHLSEDMSNDLDEMNNSSFDEFALSGGWRVLSSGLLVLLMILSGGFLAVFIYMYLFSDSDSTNHRPKSNPVEQRSVPEQPAKPKLTDKERELQQRYRIARQFVQQRKWDEAYKHLNQVAQETQEPKLKQHAQILLRMVSAEQKAQKVLQDAQKQTDQKQWIPALLSLQGIPPNTQAASFGQKLQQTIESTYVAPAIKLSKKHERRRRYKQALALLQPIVQAVPKHSNAQQQYKKLLNRLKSQHSRCENRCKRQYRRRNQRRKLQRCSNTCQRAYPLPTSSTQIASASAVPQPTPSTVAPTAQNTACQKQCQDKHLAQFQKCTTRCERRNHYWCRYHCKRRHSSRKYRNRCYHNCDKRKQRTSQMCERNRACRPFQKRYNACLKRCKP